MTPAACHRCRVVFRTCPPALCPRCGEPLARGNAADTLSPLRRAVSEALQREGVIFGIAGVAKATGVGTEKSVQLALADLVEAGMVESVQVPFHATRYSWRGDVEVAV